MSHHDDQPSDPRPTTHPLVHLAMAVLAVVCIVGIAAVVLIALADALEAVA